jgi:hypothetical protein
LARWSKVVAVAAVLAASGAHATVYDETVTGDLSDDASNPTAIGSLTPGQNSIIGSSIPSGPVIDPTGALANQDNDYVSFTVPHGYQLTQIDFASPGSSLTGDDRMFFAIAQGSGVFLTGLNGPATGLLGWTLVSESMVGSDLLPALGLSAPDNFPSFPGATGFSGPLDAGLYTLWILDGDHPAYYNLDLVVAAVPEPSTWLLMAAGLGLIVALRRRGSAWRLGGDRSAWAPAPC